ncbi:penicillin-binding protein 1B [Vibrio cincinnatiensis]|jgi:penicillin-binding protein 1B|uniref:penicillin-binding protein 1B n=1 Tax=Vibrio cincinnatiensis TaxID=675 RepID=UPI0012AC6D7B|nr:penicillin-binding protein 1B [Vibrio cincinnatiensis]MCG3731474.1 penicillin-binding protein 1B [Vibrio cincinnatiensis]MCG3739169.1 penicillin-binding protein 1B [Vibrio cincinnatiensis]MCG3742553.1 penicillin-binding protein 1B [Vibrio cincinnatiensis]MCG3758160.1 penicillin-binding protein 1B [Vibrio cincinnatiensis]MCG3761456.1 penicillin-binding protein 1B [Vibrio cincinnatiensis]
MTQKKTPTKRSSSRKKPNSKTKKTSWGLRLWGVVWKGTFALAAVLLVSGLYLNSVVKQRFEGQLFDLPTVVYARILTLQPGDPITLSEVRNELDVLNYRKVAHPRFPGEYSSSSTKIELIRRPFEFSDGPEPDRHVMLSFDQHSLTQIQSLEQRGQLGYLRLDPKMLGMLEKDTIEQRLFLRREQFPEVMVDALLATEDRYFYQHDGISPFSIARAMLANIKAGRTVQGGSTLTQQLAKNIFLSSDRTLWRKLREAYMALIIDYRYSKDRILEAYLNEVYLGQNGREAIHGFGLASRLYFGQPLQELRIDQLALLVGMVKGPSYYHPVRYPERAKERRDLVLKLMMEQNILTANQYEQAVSRSLDVQKHPHIASRQPAYFQQLSIELKEKVGERFQMDKGLRVFSSLDPVSQAKLEQSISQQVSILAKQAGNELEAAAIAVDRSSGEIRAMVGGKRTGYDGFNRVLNASRPIGSLVKPAVYLTALAQPEKYHLATTLMDKPMSLKGSGGTVWTPRNFDRQYRGEVPLYQALAQSLNVPTVQLGMSLGIDTVSNTLQKLGVSKDEIRPVPSMFLGSFSLSPFQVAQMYQTITNSGKKAPLSALRSVSDLQGNVLYQSIPKASQVVDQQAAWLTTFAMKQGVREGTGRYLNNQFAWAALAGKTGTSSDRRDSWFVGVDGREVTTIWLGRDDNQATQLTGSSGALRVYADYLQHRVPEQLLLPWPQGISTFGFMKTPSGALSLDCDNPFTLPVWDKSGNLKQQCENRPKEWLKNIFRW